MAFEFFSREKDGGKRMDGGCIEGPPQAEQVGLDGMLFPGHRSHCQRTAYKEPTEASMREKTFKETF